MSSDSEASTGGWGTHFATMEQLKVASIERQQGTGNKGAVVTSSSSATKTSCEGAAATRCYGVAVAWCERAAATRCYRVAVAGCERAAATQCNRATQTRCEDGEKMRATWALGNETSRDGDGARTEKNKEKQRTDQGEARTLHGDEGDKENLERSSNDGDVDRMEGVASGQNKDTDNLMTDEGEFEATPARGAATGKNVGDRKKMQDMRKNNTLVVASMRMSTRRKQDGAGTLRLIWPMQGIVR